MEYEEYTKRYCDNCINKDCTRIPVNNDGSLIDKDNPNICRYFKQISEYTTIVNRLKDAIIVIKAWYSPIHNSEEILEALDKAINIVEFIGENDLIRRDDVYNFLEYSCNSIQEAIDNLYELDKVDLDFMERSDLDICMEG